ncbi:MAG TPA: anti-sigma regulatory factor [Limnochordia bacterium]
MTAQPIRSDRFPIRASEDMVAVRQHVRKIALEIGLSLVDQTKVVTAASELARNTLIHGHGGWCTIELVEGGGRKALRASFEDQGPGIADVDRALQDGFTTAGGLGLGLGGAKRLSNEFEIVTKPGQGTKVTIMKWKG